MTDTDTPPLPQSLTAESDIAAYEIVIADDDDNVRHALAGLLGDHPGFVLVGQAATGIEAAQMCARLTPHVALIDVMMPAGGCEAATAIVAGSPSTIVAAYTAKSDRRTEDELTNCGVAKVFVKGRGDDLATALYELVQQHHLER